jgi:hypothetical protein
MPPVPKKKTADPEATTIRVTNTPDAVKAAFEALQAERRSTPRVPMKVAVRFESPPAFTKALSAYTANIGMGGLCILTSKEYEIATPLRVQIDVSPDQSLEVEGTVAWVRRGVAIGVRFEPLTKELSSAIAALVQKAVAPK